MVEVVVMSGIMIVITAIFVGGFPLFNQNAFVKKEGETVALDLRGAQNYGILGRVAPNAGTTPRYWGFHIDIANPDRYVVFADTNGNKQYNAGTDEVIKTYLFENGVRVSSLASPLSSSESELNFVFQVPYGDTEIRNSSANVGSYGRIRLISRLQSIKRDVTMRVSGQISISE